MEEEMKEGTSSDTDTDENGSDDNKPDPAPAPEVPTTSTARVQKKEIATDNRGAAPTGGKALGLEH